MLKRINLAKLGILTLITLSLVIYNSYAQISEEEALTKGIDYSQQGKYDEAIAEFNKVIETTPNSAAAYYNRGVIYDRRGNLNLAIADYSKCIEINPDSADAYYNRGFAYYKKNKFDLAISDFNNAIKIRPNSPDAYYGRGLVYSKKSNLNQALSDYSKAIQIRPDFTLAYDARAAAYLHKNSYIRALADVHKAESLGYRARPLKNSSADLVKPEDISISQSEKKSQQVVINSARIGLVQRALLILGILFCFLPLHSLFY